MWADNVMRIFLSIVFCGITASVGASDLQVQSPDQNAANEQTAVIDVLAQRSKLNIVELRKLLAHCDASQQNMYFCAWRDQISADSVLARTLADKQRTIPQCASVFRSEVEKWGKSRDRACAELASKAWGDGSMRPTAQTLCLADETLKMAKQLARINQCRRR